jgi:hypothetical protein
MEYARVRSVGASKSIGSTPGWEPSLGGFPALSGGVGQFLLKDVVLLGAAVWSLGEGLTARGNNLQFSNVQGMSRNRGLMPQVPASSGSEAQST